MIRFDQIIVVQLKKLSVVHRWLLRWVNIHRSKYTDTDSILSKTLVVEKGERINPEVEYEYINGIVRSGTITYTFSDVYRSEDLYLADKAELYKNALSVYDKAKSELLAAGYEDLTKPSGAKYKKGDVIVEVNTLMNSRNFFVEIKAEYKPIVDRYRN